MKGALQAHDFDQCFKYLKELKAAWASRCTTEPLMPSSIMGMLVDLAWKEQQLSNLVVELRGASLPEKTIDCMLAKCVVSSKKCWLEKVHHFLQTSPKQLYNFAPANP